MGNVSSLPVNGFKWNQNTFKFNEGFIKNYDEETKKGYFLEVDVEHLKRLDNLHSNLPINLYAVCYIRKQCYSHKSFQASIKSWINFSKST